MTAAKACTRCGEVKSLDEFGFHAARSDKRKSWCKPCHADYARSVRAEQRPDYLRNQAINRVRQRAERRVAAAHPDEFRVVLAEEMAAAGLSYYDSLAAS